MLGTKKSATGRLLRLSAVPDLFRWAEPASEVLIHGLDKVALDLLNIPLGGEISQSQWDAICDGARLVHARNLARQPDAAFREADEEQRMARWLAHKRKQTPVAVQVTKLKVTLDQIDLPPPKETPDSLPVGQPVPAEATLSYVAPARSYEMEMVDRAMGMRQKRQQMQNLQQQIYEARARQANEDPYYTQYNWNVYERGRRR